MRSLGLVSAVGLAACGFNAGGVASDGRIDDAIDRDSSVPADANQCFGTSPFTICLASLPGADPVMLDGTINTVSDARCLLNIPAGWTTDGQRDACIIPGETIVVGSVSVTGTRPLVLLATGALTVSGALDVASHRDPPAKGPGSSPGACASGVGPQSQNDTGGGGAGGSFRTIGGSGGAGDDGDSAAGIPAAAVSTDPLVLRGGCPGQNGGNGVNSEAGGARGEGGGAVYLVAGEALTITGTINASGSGGAAGKPEQSGGGGGGSGGMIVLSAPTIVAIGSTIFANGGGGASGSARNAGTSATDPTATVTNGGMGEGGAGGAGAKLTMNAGAGGNGTANRGGGGGGGGGGYIRTTATLTGATVSPAAHVVP